MMNESFGLCILYDILYALQSIELNTRITSLAEARRAKLEEWDILSGRLLTETQTRRSKELENELWPSEA